MKLLALALTLGVLLSGAASAASAPSLVVALSPQTGELRSFPRVRGLGVNAIVADGQGGWYLAGEFLSVGGIGCRNLAHVRGDGTVDRAFCPRPSGGVQTLARWGRTIYIGGYAEWRFASGAVRDTLAEIDAKTGRVLPSKVGKILEDGPVSNAEVYDLVVDEQRSRLLISGSFARIGKVRRQHLAAVDLRTGEVDAAFAPNPNATGPGPSPSDSVLGLAAGPDALYVWGAFTRIGGREIENLRSYPAAVRLDHKTGRLLPWPGGPGRVWSLVVAGERIYVGHSPARGEPTLEAFDVKTLKAVPLRPEVPRGRVQALVAAPGILAGAVAVGSARPGDRNCGAYSTFFFVDPRSGRRLFRPPPLGQGCAPVVDVSGRLVLVGLRPAR